tara:strand:- start:467 stop:889 length:423 start_codon:yes stop_codon:yes gene_type:complete
MLNYFRKKKQEKMNKIVDEVVSQIEVKMENLFDHFVSRLNGQDIDYYELSQNIEYDNLGEYISDSDLAEHVQVEASDIAYHIDVMDIAGYIDCDDVAQELDTSEIAQFVEVNFDDLKSDIFSEVEDMVNSAIDDLEIKRA